MVPAVPGPARFRAMVPADVDEVHRLQSAAFEDLDRRFGETPFPQAEIAHARVRLGRVLTTDPGGCWVAEHRGRLVGCALAILRDGVWGLSLLAVHPDAQSDGVGRELLRRSYAYGDGARGRIVLASRDVRALRAYSRLGFELHPAAMATGRPRGVHPAESVRPGTLDDLPLTEAVDRAVRGAPHGDDIAALLAVGGRLLVLDDRGYAVDRDGAVRLLAATDGEAAADLLRTALAMARDRAIVEWLTARQSWAIPVCVDAGLELRLGGGAVFVAGDVGPFSPYLPSGAYL
jgi:GNAT superfamily N-acetyltransferase